ncbi:hypothetical protein PInf_021846 [Phytophthora infestans]|nr:hypothetical protein PInf_021846 [Phytophthora infestans]
MAESELLGLAGLRSVAVQSTHIQRVQLLTSSPPSSKPRTPEPSLRSRLQRQWRSNAWLLLTLGFICCWATTNAATSKSKTDNTAATSSDLYIVLVSIPVLDKVLPLKHLAESLLSRGVRVGFALPENCRQWVSDLEGLEFISLGNIVGKGRATALDPSELHSLGVYESYANTLRYYASFQRPMFGALLEDFEDERPDLVVVDRFTFAGFDACHRLQLPYVVNDPHLLFDIDSPPAYIPAPFSSFTMHTTSVLERCLNSYYRLRFRLQLVHVYKEINAVRQEHGLEAIDSKHQMHGTRFFQTDVPLTPEFITATMNALETVNARLLWKITLQEQAAFDLRSRPRDSVMFLGDGLDEATVLALAPEIELLVTAGDFASMQEALVAGVPVLGLPHSAEQVEGVNAVVRAGAGLQLDGKSFSESSLRDAVNRMLVDEHEHFKANAEHLGKLLKTGGGVDRAVNELLAVAKFGARHLLPMRNLQPLYKTYLVDVYLIYGAILCGAAIILRTFVSVVLSIFQPLTPLEVLEAEELAANGQGSRADEVAHKAVQ